MYLLEILGQNQNLNAHLLWCGLSRTRAGVFLPDTCAARHIVSMLFRECGEQSPFIQVEIASPPKSKSGGSQ
jgi:hypothetical protein